MPLWHTAQPPATIRVTRPTPSMEHERLVVRVSKRQKDWLRSKATEFKTTSHIIRELIDREIEASSRS